MINNDEPYLIEYNVRMGDPECQTILPLLENDFLEILESCVNRTLDKIELKWKAKKVFVLFCPLRVIQISLKIIFFKKFRRL